jgi:hypothetical protein
MGFCCARLPLQEAMRGMPTQGSVPYSGSFHTLLTVKFLQPMRTMCGSRTGGWSLPCVMSD